MLTVIQHAGSVNNILHLFMNFCEIDVEWFVICLIPHNCTEFLNLWIKRFTVLVHLDLILVTSFCNYKEC